jgi:hypothetical protein
VEEEVEDEAARGSDNKSGLKRSTNNATNLLLVLAFTGIVLGDHS